MISYLILFIYFFFYLHSIKAHSLKSVLVFFETQYELELYQDSEKFNCLNIDPLILSEELSVENRDFIIKKA